ncbi:MAG: asparagine synthase (glutamine-hydrolyzing) [Legionella sp.]
MCGIIGIYSTDAPINPMLLDKAQEALKHRGPDGRGAWIAPNQKIGLAHTRLSINDSDNGAQPLLNREANLCASVNGEFYGYQELRAQLLSKGYVFKTQSDSELALHLYEEYGLNFVDHLRGEFAILLYDAKRNRMIAVRDRFGIKPLSYHYSNQGFYAASEAKALFALGIKAKWNEFSLYHAFSFQYPQKDSTLFKDILQVPPGHIMIFDGQSLQSTCYWDLNYPSTEATGDFNCLSQELELQLRQALNIRLQADSGKICCHLSGGIDSATIAALGSELYGRALPCFTVSFNDDPHDELAFASNLAKKIGADLHPVHVGIDDINSVMADAVYHSEGLAINNHLSAKFLLNRAIKQAGFKIALSGEGSDELFAGYSHLQEDYAPQSTKDDFATGIYRSDDPGLSLELLQKNFGFIPSFIKAKAAMGLKIHALLDCDQFSASQVYTSIATENKVAHLAPVYQASHLWMKYALSSYILKTLGDGCEMAHGIEGRVPFLDHHLFEFSKRIPLSMKIQPNSDKYIFRQTMQKYLTAEIANKKKQAFFAPPFSMRAKGYEFLRDNLLSLTQVPFINKEKLRLYLDSIPNKSPKEQKTAEPVLMLLLSASLLAKAYNL